MAGFRNFFVFNLGSLFDVSMFFFFVLQMRDLSRSVF